jgi:hypothetical protein
VRKLHATEAGAHPESITIHGLRHLGAELHEAAVGFASIQHRRAESPQLRVHSPAIYSNSTGGVVYGILGHNPSVTAVAIQASSQCTPTILPRLRDGVGIHVLKVRVPVLGAERKASSSLGGSRATGRMK